MKNTRELLGGLITAVLIVLIVLGALTLSLVEGMSSPIRAIEATETPFELPTYPVVIAAATTESVATPTVTATIACSQPSGWVEHIVQFGDSIEDLAVRTGLAASRLREANCLLSDELVTGTILFLPPSALTTTSAPLISPTSFKCGPPADWISYLVKSHDTLFRISLDYGVSVPQLQLANCMGNSTFLRVGDLIYVPNVVTRTPDYSPTPTGTKVPTQTSTPETVIPTETPTPDLTVTPAESLTP